MGKVLKQKGRMVFYFVDDEVVLPEGDLEVEDLQRQTMRVDAAAIAPYEVPEDRAKGLVREEALRIRRTAEAQAERLREAAAEIRQAAAELQGMQPEIMAAAAKHLSKLDASSVVKGLEAPVQEVVDRLREVLLANADTPEGMAQLERFAWQVKQAGGPDFTEDPARASRQIKKVLGDPELLGKLGAMWQEIREEAPARREALREAARRSVGGTAAADGGSDPDPADALQPRHDAEGQDPSQS